jgi:hypothetical protein
MYTACDDIINKAGTVTKYNEVSGILKRVVSMAQDLKKYIEFYLTNTFNTKTYIDNVVNFQKYLTILNGIKMVLSDTCNNEEKQAKLDESVIMAFKEIF